MFLPYYDLVRQLVVIGSVKENEGTYLLRISNTSSHFVV
jgi:hypothetical protein